MPDAIQTQGLQLIYDSGAGTDLNPGAVSGVETWKSPVFDTSLYSTILNIVTIESASGGGSPWAPGIQAYMRVADPTRTPLASNPSNTSLNSMFGMASNFTTTGTKQTTFTVGSNSNAAVIASYWNQTPVPPFYEIVIWSAGTATAITGRVRVYGRI